MTGKTRDTGKSIRKNSLWLSILPGIVILLLVGALVWWMYARLEFETKIAAFLQRQNITADEIKVDVFGRYTLKNIRPVQSVAGNSAIIEDVHGRFVPFARHLSLQAANIRFDTAAFTLFIPQLAVDKARIDMALLPEKSTAPSFADILAGFTAKSIAAPEVFIKYNYEDSYNGLQNFYDNTYKDVRFEDITGSRIALYTLANIHQEMTARRLPDSNHIIFSGVVDTGAFEMHDLNSAAVAELYFGGTGVEKDRNSYELLHGAYRLNNITYRDRFAGSDIAQFRLEEVSGTGFSMAPVSFSLLNLRDMIGQEAADAEEKQKHLVDFIHSLFELSGAFGSFDMELKGLTVAIAAESEMHFDRLGFDYKSGIMDFTLDNFHIITDSTKIFIANLVMDKVSFPNLIKTIEEELRQSLAGDMGNRGAADLNMRMSYALVPRLDSMQLSGLRVEKADRKDGARFMAMEKLGMRLENRIGAMPTGLFVSMSKLQLPVSVLEGKGFVEPDGADNNYLKTLGYEDYIDSDIVLDIKWNEAKQQIVLNEFSADMAGLGSFKLGGTIGNVTKTFFVDNPVAMGISAAGFRLRDVHLGVSKNGIWQRLVERQAETTGKTVEEARAEEIASIRHYVADKVAGDNSEGDNSEILQPLEPVFTYLNAGGILSVDVVSKNPAGVGLLDFALNASNPWRSLGYFDFQVKSQGAEQGH